ncbi:MAG TPA: cytochrome c [Bryobacteraceae bacterium]|nr:cytochrome c [Bryobacteraceae bacterium]
MNLRALALAGMAAGAAPLFGAEVTYTDVAPTLYKHCATCHHPDDIAPMALLTYQQTRPWAAAIREVVLTRQMPPWKADPHYGKWSNDWSLGETEIAAIKAWVDQGAKEGDPRGLPAPPVFSTDWRIGKPDLVISIPPHSLAPDGPDEYEYFKVPTNFTEDRWIVAAELRPGNRRIVHHAHVFVNAPEKPKPATPKKEEKPDPQAEYSEWLRVHEGKLSWIRYDAPVIDDGCVVDDNSYWPGDKPRDENFGSWGLISSYLPGREPDVYPEGTARKIPAGSTLGFQIHYSKSTKKPETDVTSVGLIFAKEPPKQVAKRVDLSNYFFRIPAGDPNVEVSECHTFKQDMYLTSLTPHMHLRGKDARFEATYPDGRKETLLLVPHYNFHWQITYRMAEPKFIPKGTRLAIISHFDNSPNNLLNPDPTKVVRWGEASEMEMMDGWIEYLDAPSTIASLNSP